VSTQDRGGVPPVALIAVLYERPIWPFGSDVVVMLSGGSGGGDAPGLPEWPPEQLHSSSRAGTRISACGALRCRGVSSNIKLTIPSQRRQALQARRVLFVMRIITWHRALLCGRRQSTTFCQWPRYFPTAPCHKELTVGFVLADANAAIRWLNG
jgi:hypothetical protein